MEVRVIESTKGKELILLNNFKYRKCYQLQSGEMKWRCSVKTCSAKIYTMGEDYVIIKSEVLHSHNSDIKKLHRQILSTSCKRKAAEDLTEVPAKIIRRELQKELSPLITTTDVECVRRNIYACRRRHLPSVLPKSLEETQKTLSLLNLKTSKNEDFLLINNFEKKIVVFCCESNIQVLSKMTTVYMDGTFSYCANYFAQLFTIHGIENGHYIPLMFCLLPSKTTDSYTNLFQLIKEKMSHKQLIFEPKAVIVDFELAIHKSLRVVWPNAHIIGCRFHLTQAWYRKIQSLGLSNEYKNNYSAKGKWLKLTFGLMYLNPCDVGDTFTDLYAEMPNDLKLIEYADYLVDNYISEEATFSPDIWAKCTASLARTTNACESFHSRLNNSFYQTHPSIYVFTAKIQDFQIDTYVKIQSLKQSNKIKNKYVLCKERYIKKLIMLLNSKKINNVQFIKCLYNKVAPM